MTELIPAKGIEKDNLGEISHTKYYKLQYYCKNVFRLFLFCTFLYSIWCEIFHPDCLYLFLLSSIRSNCQIVPGESPFPSQMAQILPGVCDIHFATFQYQKLHRFRSIQFSYSYFSENRAAAESKSPVISDACAAHSAICSALLQVRWNHTTAPVSRKQGLLRGVR